MEKKVDRRVRKTKKLLRQALTTLMKEKPIQKIKVREIAELIDINRGTFYQHYSDIYDMLDKVEGELFNEFESILKSYSSENKDFQNMMTKVFSLFEENSDLVVSLMKPTGDLAFVDKIKELIKEHCIEDWRDRFNIQDMKKLEYYYTFIESGCIGLLQKWLEDGAEESPEELTNLVEQFIYKCINLLK